MLFSYDTDILPRVRMIGKINYIKPWIHFARTADEFILYVIREGEMFLEEDGIRYHLKKGDYFLLEPELFHKGYREASCSYYYVHFKHPGLIRVHPQDEEQAVREMLEKRCVSLLSYSLDEKDPTDPFALFQKQDSILEYLDFKGYLNLGVSLYNRREEHYKRFASVELHRFLMNIAHVFVVTQNALKTGGSVKKSVVKVDGILNFLNSSYMHKITSEMIEEKFEVNFDYINRVFSEHNGNTIFHYLNSIRISHAKELIRTTNLNFSEIAYLTGIEDAYYFTKIFKKYSGMTPTQYYQSCSSEMRE